MTTITISATNGRYGGDLHLFHSMLSSDCGWTKTTTQWTQPNRLAKVNRWHLLKGDCQIPRRLTRERKERESDGLDDAGRPLP